MTLAAPRQGTRDAGTGRRSPRDTDRGWLSESLPTLAGFGPCGAAALLARRHHVVDLLGADAAAGDLAGHDPYEQVVLPGRPWPQAAAFAEVSQLARLQHPVRVTADQHAPPLTKFQVKVIGLE